MAWSLTRRAHDLIAGVAESLEESAYVRPVDDLAAHCDPCLPSTLAIRRQTWSTAIWPMGNVVRRWLQTCRRHSREDDTGVLLAAVTALISGVAIFINGYGVRAWAEVADATTYTTLKNAGAAMILVAAARRGPVPGR